MKAKQYIKSLDLSGTPRPRATLAAAVETAPVFDAAKNQAQIVASGIFSFAQGVKEKTRAAISDSALLAQLVANKAVDAGADPTGWYTKYTEVLQNIGWVLQEGGWNDYTARGTAVEVNEKIAEVLGLILGPSATALAIITSTLNALKAMSDNSPWITLFARESQKAKIARFQVGVAEKDSQGGVMVTMLACVVTAKNDITQVLFFKFKSANATFSANSTKVSINVPALTELAPAIREKTRAYQMHYLSSITDLPDLPATSGSIPVLKNTAGAHRVLDARPDTPDFRDRMYEATLIEVPPRLPLAEYQKVGTPILDQGQEGACTGFGLATVANYLLRRRRIDPDRNPVSPRMFYEMARRYDEWPGEDYSGSSARGAMKGWHKHGVCSEKLWAYNPNETRGTLDSRRASDALQRPLGSYYRVNHQDLVCMHSALAETGILYATARVHAGWQAPSANGSIQRQPEIIGGHAFAIVAFDERGFWIQNSWGTGWGKGGFGHITYDDWLANGTDTWVARIGAPVLLETAEATARGNAAASGGAIGYTSADLRPHIISLGNDGRLEPGGTYGKTSGEVRAIFQRDIPEIMKAWSRKRILLYAHGGLVGETLAIQHVADYRAALLEAEVFPLAFVWHSDFWSTLKDILADAVGRRLPAGFLDATKNFMLDRLDDALEPVARAIGGKAEWDEMKENATAATTTANGGARLIAECLADLMKNDGTVELHLVGHSCGAVFHAPLLQFLATKGRVGSGPMQGRDGLGLPVASCTLWAPACTVDLFKQTYVPVLDAEGLRQLAVFTMTDQAEQDDNCAYVYNKSLLYLVSNAFETKERIPFFRGGWPILGMEKFIRQDAELTTLFTKTNAAWVLSPNEQQIGSANASRATSHGGFDDDEATLKATLARIVSPVLLEKFVLPRASGAFNTQRLSIGRPRGNPVKIALTSPPLFTLANRANRSGASPVLQSHV